MVGVGLFLYKEGAKFAKTTPTSTKGTVQNLSVFTKATAEKNTFKSTFKFTFKSILSLNKKKI